MNAPDYCLFQVSDFFSLLIRSGEKLENSWLRKRLKKDPGVLGGLFDLIERLDAMGYQDGVEFAFVSRRFDTIKDTPLSLIEIRRLENTWRVVAYWSRSRKHFVLLDAFKAHEHIRMSEMIERVTPLALIAKSLLEGDE